MINCAKRREKAVSHTPTPKAEKWSTARQTSCVAQWVEYVWKVERWSYEKLKLQQKKKKKRWETQELSLKSISRKWNQELTPKTDLPHGTKNRMSMRSTRSLLDHTPTAEAEKCLSARQTYRLAKWLGCESDSYVTGPFAHLLARFCVTCSFQLFAHPFLFKFLLWKLLPRMDIQLSS